MEAIEVVQVEELSRLKEENKKLEGELRSRDERIKALADNNADLIDKVATFEAKSQAAEEYLKEAKLARDTKITRAAEEAVLKFKQFEEFTALLKKEHDAGYDMGYDVSVEEIFFNILGEALRC